MAYNIDCTKATIPEALEVLADAVLNPKFQSWEVAEQVGGWVEWRCRHAQELHVVYWVPKPANRS